MAELVDALVSGASVERRAGSSPVLGTEYKGDLSKSYKNLTRSSWLRVKRRNGGRPNSRSEFNATSAFRRSAGGEIGIHATLRG